MAVVPRLPRILLAAMAVAGGFRIAQRRAIDGRERVAALEREAVAMAAAAQQALRLRDEFLATLSHELRTPLNAMLGWVQLLRVHADQAPMRDHAIDVIERNARAQVQIVSDLLDVSCACASSRSTWRAWCATPRRH